MQQTDCCKGIEAMSYSSVGEPDSRVELQSRQTIRNCAMISRVSRKAT